MPPCGRGRGAGTWGCEPQNPGAGGEVLPRPATACRAGGAGSRAFQCKKRFLSFQRRIYFRIRSRELELYLSVPDDVEDMKAGRVVVSSLSEQSSSVWYYEDGLIKNQVRAHV